MSLMQNEPTMQPYIALATMIKCVICDLNYSLNIIEKGYS